MDYAQDQRIDEIIVTEGEIIGKKTLTATKTNTPLIDVPQSISVVTRVQLDEQAFADIGDILRYIPGASIGQGEGYRDQFTIRGQNTTADFFIDGLRDDVQYFRPLYNLERVEILRGANAMIFGHGGGGGVFNRVQKTPTASDEFVGLISSVDTFGAVMVAGDANIAIDDTSAFRVNAFYEHLNNHRDEFEGDRFAINPTYSTELGLNTKLLLSYEYVQDDRVVDRGVPALKDNTPLRGFDNTFFGDPDANLTDLRTHIVKARIDHEFSDTLVFNTTAQYADFDKLYQNIYPAGFVGATDQVTLDGYVDATDRQNFIIQSNLVAEFETGSLSHTLLLGAEYGTQDTENSRIDIRFDASNDDQITIDFTDPLNIPSFNFDDPSSRDRTSDVNFLSFYLQDQVDIGDHIKVVGGLRYDRFEIDVFDRVADRNGGQAVLTRTGEEVSPRIGVIYKPAEDISFYANYSISFLPRSGDQFLTLSPTTENLAPEQFDNYEVGLKVDLTGELSLTAAVFRLDREGGITVDPTDPERDIVIGSRTDGFGVQLVGEVVDGWRINAGYSYLDASERGRVVQDALANRVLSQVPENMFSLWNRVDVTEKLGFGLGVTYQDTQFANISNTTELPDFVRVDAALFYNVRENTRLQLNVENLFDTNYFPAAHNNDNITTGEPFNVRLTLNTRF